MSAETIVVICTFSDGRVPIVTCASSHEQLRVIARAMAVEADREKCQVSLRWFRLGPAANDHGPN